MSQELAQAQSNRKAVSDLSLGVVTMFLTAITVPLGGVAIKYALSPTAPVVATNIANTPTPPVPIPTEIIKSFTNTNISETTNANSLANINNTNSNINSNTNSNANISNFSELANVDINLLSDWEKGEKAEEMFQKGVELTKANNYSLAVKYYREALKFKSSEAKFYHELGYGLYRSKKYQDSVEALKKAGSLGSTGKNSQEILGLNYIELKKWNEAQKIFADLSRNDYYSFSAHYNLGFAAKNSGDLSAASEAFERAVQIKPNNAQAHFELGMCYGKLEQTSDTDREYQILLRLNPALANRLYQEALNR